MGLIKAAAGAVGGTLADQWLEFFSLDSLPTEVLVTKGSKTINGRSSNTKGSDNIISNGSGIIVADGQAIALINNGIVVEFASEPGMYTFDASSEPSIFAGGGGLGANIMAVFKESIERFKRGGGVRSDQRVYYFNIKEILGNKYGTAEPIPYRVVDADIGLDMDVDLRCNGEFSYKLINPILFYQNVAGNVGGEYTRDMIDSQLKAELLNGLNVALSKVSAQGIRYSALPGQTMLIADELNQVLSSKWRDLRGLEVVSFAINSVSVSDEDEKRIKDLQAAKSLRDPNMAGAVLAGAQADAMREAAANEGGAMLGFMGLGMANAAGGTTAQGMFNQAAQTGATVPPSSYPVAADGGFGVAGGGGAAVPPGAVAPGAAVGAPVPAPMPAPAPGAAPPPPNTAAAGAAGAAPWTCPSCGQGGNVGNFCANCGSPKPQPPAPGPWICTNCGQQGNTGNFCANCGAPKQP
ncbi:MAG: SPFH domain-containing protein [Actinomycetia bacterium]|nr:SPFH domain-containing protein [Actinomycetes bacterium]